MKNLMRAACAITLFAFNSALAGETPSAPGAKVFFKNLKEGDTVKSPLKVEFGVEGMELATAATDKPLSGHHHLFIDRPAFGKAEMGAEELDANIPSDEHNVHFGKAQTETMLELPTGSHTLQLVLGDKDHIPHKVPVTSEVIHIVVQ